MEIVGRAAWPREEHYRFFAPMSDPFYSLTFPVDVTALRAYVKGRGLSFYPAMVFLATKAMEDVEAFRLLDGYHVGQFYTALNARLSALEEAGHG